MRWNELTSGELAQLPRDATVVLFPIGSIEVHGNHLPLGTDSMVIQRIAESAAEREPPALVLPTLDYAYVNENIHFPGTVTLSGKTLISIVEEICDEVSRNGFKKIILLNGHGGNNEILRAIQRGLLRGKRDYVTYMYIEPWGPIRKEIEELAKGATIEHACEIETSTALYLIGDLVKMDRVTHEASLGSTDVPSTVKTQVSFPSYCIEGYVGDPRRATKEKGSILVEKWVEDVANLIRIARGDRRSPAVLKDYYRRANSWLE